MPRRLRAFFRTRTLQGSTGQFSLSGKDAILTRGGAPIPTYIPPDWLDPLPEFTFIEGVPSSQTFSGYFVDGNGGTSTIAGANLPPGVTVNSASRTLVYDGNGAAWSSTTATLTADDGYEDFTALTTLIVRDTAGTAGMVFAEGDVPSDRYISSTHSGVQARVKNSWPDGSAKIAVISWSGVTASQASPATLSIGRSASPQSGTDLTLATLRATLTSGSVALGSYGTVDIPTVIAGAQFRTWILGPRCAEWHWRSQVGTDPTLGVWLYVRMYENGRVWIRTTVENTSVGKLSSVLQVGKRYHAVVTINGVTRYNSQTDSSLAFSAINHSGSPGNYDPSGGTPWYAPWSAGDMLPHWSRSRWTKTFWYDGGAEEVPSHDPAYLKATKLFPNYVQVNPAIPAWLKTSGVPLNVINCEYYMPGGGSVPGIGYLPDWDCLYLTNAQGSTNQAAAYRSVIANACAADAYGRFMRDETTHDLPVWSDYQNLYYTLNRPPGDGNAVGTQYDGSPYRSDGAHYPSFGYTAYLISGDFYHIETLWNSANFNWASNSYNDREGIKGLLWGWDYQVRAFGWSFRTLAQALCVTPESVDASSYEYKMAPIYRDSLNYNVARQLACFVDGNLSGVYSYANFPNTLGLIADSPYMKNMAYFIQGDEAGLMASGKPLWRGDAPWQQAYVGTSLAHVENMKIAGAGGAELQRLVDHSLKLPVSMMGMGDATGWPYIFGGCFNVPFIRKTSADGYAAWHKASDWNDCFQWFMDSLLQIHTVTMSDIRVGLPSTGAAFFWTGQFSPPMSGDTANVMNGYVGGPVDWSDSTWSYMMPAVVAAADRNSRVSGGLAAYSRMLSITGPTEGSLDHGGWSSHSAGWASHPKWNEAPR